MNLKRYIPDQKALRKSRLFRLFERFTHHDQDLWHMNRHSVSEAIFWSSSLPLLTHAVSDGPLLAALHLAAMQYSNRDRRSVDFQPHHHGANDVFRLQTRRSCD